MKYIEPARWAAPLSSLNSGGRRIIVVDLNNLSRFPTLAIGILVASLRNAGHSVQLISPLANGVPAFERERRETYLDHLQRRLNLTTRASLQVVRDLGREARRWWLDRPHPAVLRETKRALRTGPDVVLLSAYMQHSATAKAIGKLAKFHSIPLLIGGPMFNIGEAAEYWRRTPGLTAIVGAEVDLSIPSIVEAVCSGQDLIQFAGVVLPDGRKSAAAAPFRALNTTPTPDFTDFPWDRYQGRVIPLMASRGCQWNRCTFCSDIISANGRTFRTRTTDGVLHEMREQSRRFASKDFIFLDLKLNSNPELLRGIVDGLQAQVPGAQWIGTVHVDMRKDNGLSPPELKRAVRAGMRRVSFGLESGSQRLLDAMDKGCSVEGNSAFLHAAHDAGLSVRCTMFKGFPGESPEDVELTAAFLEQHRERIDRIRLNDFALIPGTKLHSSIVTGEFRHEGFELLTEVPRTLKTNYRHRAINSAKYHRAKARLLRVVYEINRKRLRSSARQFDGLM